MVKHTVILLTGCTTIYKLSLLMACLVGVFPICALTKNCNSFICGVLSYTYVGLWTLCSIGIVVLRSMTFSIHKQVAEIELIRYLNPSEQCVAGFISMAFGVILESFCRYTWLFKIRNFIPRYLRFLESVDYNLHCSSWYPVRKSADGTERKEMFIILTVLCYCVSYSYYILRSVEERSLNSMFSFVICFCASVFQIHFTASGLMLQRKFRMLNVAVMEVLPFRSKAVTATRLQALKLCHLKLCSMIRKHNAAFYPGLHASVFAVFCELVVVQYVAVFGLLENPESQNSALFIISLELITVDFLIRLIGYFLVSIHISGEATKIKRLLVDLDCIKSHPDFREEISLFLDQVDSSVTYHKIFCFFNLDERNLCHILASIYSCIFILGQFGRHCASFKSPCGEHQNTTTAF